MTNPEPIHIKVDVTNPGQFFACCGLLELADRLWPGAEGWFDTTTFKLSTEGTVREILNRRLSNRKSPMELLVRPTDTSSHLAATS